MRLSAAAHISSQEPQLLWLDVACVCCAGVLKDRVTSPGGTTITGLAELESSGVRGAYIRAIQAAAARSAEMSKLL